MIEVTIVGRTAGLKLSLQMKGESLSAGLAVFECRQRYDVLEYLLLNSHILLDLP